MKNGDLGFFLAMLLFGIVASLFFLNSGGYL